MNKKEKLQNSSNKNKRHTFWSRDRAAKLYSIASLTTRFILLDLNRSLRSITTIVMSNPMSTAQSASGSGRGAAASNRGRRGTTAAAAQPSRVTPAASERASSSSSSMLNDSNVSPTSSVANNVDVSRVGSVEKSVEKGEFPLKSSD